MRLLYWGDSPTARTGYGTVARYVLAALAGAGISITAVGLSHPGHPELVPGIEAHQGVRGDGRDPWGLVPLQLALEHVRPDVVLGIADPQPLAALQAAVARASSRPKLVCYSAPDWPDTIGLVGEQLEAFDLVVVPTMTTARWVAHVADCARLEVVPHGVDLQVFRRAPELGAAWRALHGVPERAHLVAAIAANTPKKNLAALLQAFEAFRHRRPGAMLYLHTTPTGTGGDLVALCRELGLASLRGAAVDQHGAVDGPSVLFPANDPPYGEGSSPDDMAALLNAADCLAITSYSEGWCLPMTDAFAVGCPVVAPLNLVFEEIAAGRAWLYDSAVLGRTWVREWSQMRPVIHPPLVEAALERTDRRDERVSRAQTWVEGLDWRLVCQVWPQLLEEVTR